MKEPAVVLGAISEILRQLVPMLIIFGLVHWTPEQTAAVFAFSSAVLTALTVVTTRTQTVSTQTANAQIETALQLPATTLVSEVVERTASK